MATNPNIDDSTRARAMKFVSDNAGSTVAKPRVVGKKELADSGLSLRDFLNKERGLVRRGSSADPTAGEAKDRKAQEAADRIDPGNDGGESVVRRQDAEAAKRAKDAAANKPRRSSTLSEVSKPGTNTNYENSDTSDMTFKCGGAVKKMASGGSVARRGDGLAQRGRTRGKVV